MEVSIDNINGDSGAFYDPKVDRLTITWENNQELRDFIKYLEEILPYQTDETKKRKFIAQPK